MKSKEELLKAINEMPKFEYREIALKVPTTPVIGPPVDRNDSQVIEAQPATYQDVPACWTAITEVGKSNPICFASSKYKLMQFKEAFEPLVSAHEDVEGKLVMHQGFAVLDLFPKDQNMTVATPAGDVYKIGMSAYNSVDRTSALMIRFSVTDNDRIITFPKNVATYYQAHVGQVKEKTDAYQKLMTQIKEFWPQIVNDMSSTEVTKDLFGTITKDFKTDPQIVKALQAEVEAGAKYNLWSMMMEIYDRMGRKYSKSDVHLRKRQDDFIQSVMDWAKMIAVFM